MDPHPWDQWQQRAQEREARRQAREERRAQRRAQCGPNPGGGMMFGLIVVAIGVLFLLNNLGIIYIEEFWQYWPVILIALGLPKIFSLHSAQSVTWGLVLSGVGTLFLLRNLDVIPASINIWQFIWPVLIIAWGVSMLAAHLDWTEQRDMDASAGPPDPASGVPPGVTPGSRASNAPRVHVDVFFSGDQRRIISQEFEGGRISAVFGGVELDLRGAGTKLPEVRINADAVFGGVDIRIPETWIADVRGSGVFGGYVDKTAHVAPPDGSAAPRVLVKGGAVFGGVTVRN